MTGAPWRDEQREVRIGPWRIALRGSELADLAHEGVVVLRGIRFVTRDRDWRTADDRVLDVRTSVDGDRGTIRITASARYDGSEVLRWSMLASIDGDTVQVDASATVSSPFARNRVGLVVLHPPTLAGLPLTVRHPSGGRTAATWPLLVAPHQPAQDVAGYEWDADGRRVDVDLSGDVFEMEDQRNWTDASYKTYSTPLAEPFPVVLQPGAHVRQAVRLRARRTGGTTHVSTPAATGVETCPTAAVARPVLQLLAGSGPVAARPDDDRLLRGFPVLVEPVLEDPDARAVLAGARRDAGDAPLDVRFITHDPEALPDAVDRLLDGGPVVRVGAFDPESHITTLELQRALRAIAAAHHGLEVVAGTRAHFTELNRTIRLYRHWHGPLTFSVTPQMHDRSRAQVIESVQMLRVVVQSAQRLAAGRLLHVGPVTLRPRFNAVATSPRPPVTDASATGGYGPEHVPDATDPAQHGPEAGRWFASAIDALTVPGVESITLAEAWGPRGLVRTDGTATPAVLAIGAR